MQTPAGVWYPTHWRPYRLNAEKAGDGKLPPMNRKDYVESRLIFEPGKRLDPSWFDVTSPRYSPREDPKTEPQP